MLVNFAHIFFCLPFFFQTKLFSKNSLCKYKAITNTCVSEDPWVLISYQSRPVVHLSVPPSVLASVTFLVNVSPPKPLDEATSNFAAE